jgi:hypothetical protein
MAKLTDDQAKALHIKDAKKAMVQLQKDKQVPANEKDYRNKCLLEFIILIETGSNDHINIQEEEKHIEHFK